MNSHTVYSRHASVPTRLDESPLLDEVHALNTCRNADGDSYELRGGQGRAAEDVCDGGNIVIALGIAFIVGCILFYLIRNP